ncbi:MAG: phosphatidic acid phosphatase [Ruminococcaceae bacterium]|nr:phosphatidic acid phosphatase [Oscillospiraceae bacterium]
MRRTSLRFDADTRHCLFLALYWPLYGLIFYAAEHLFRPYRYHVMHCALDDVIPFCEVFLIPYLFWFVYLLGIHLYTFFTNRPAFRRLMWFIILSYSIGLVFFYCYPTVQFLRPTDFPRDNILTELMAAFYRHDTNTNVCPSLHVVGAMAVWYAARDTKLFAHRGWRLFFHTSTFLICISTVFLKQHSAIDVLVGFAVSYSVYLLVYRRQEFRVPAHSYRQKKRMSY